MVGLVVRMLGRGDGAATRATAGRFTPRLEVLDGRTMPSVVPVFPVTDPHGATVSAGCLVAQPHGAESLGYGVQRTTGEEIPSQSLSRTTGEEIPRQTVWQK